MKKIKPNYWMPGDTKEGVGYPEMLTRKAVGPDVFIEDAVKTSSNCNCFICGVKGTPIFICNNMGAGAEYICGSEECIQMFVFRTL